MSVMKPKDLAKYVRGKKNPLLITGALCDELDFPEAKRKLLDYAVEINRKMKDRPIAATGNTVVGLKERGITVARTKKSWVGELVAYTRDPWMEPFFKERPDAMVFLGYTTGALNWLCSMAKDMETVALGYQAVPEATQSLPDTVSFREYQKNLEEFIKAL
ncbi:MAG: hypothetical protein AB1603_08665 [Chloroflexota bacterium]